LIYKFEWDNKKATSNQLKHKISFQEAATIFRDINVLSMYDEDHSQYEERWISLGLSSNARLIVTSHTFMEINRDMNVIRIISARKATKNEIKHYNK